MSKIETRTVPLINTLDTGYIQTRYVNVMIPGSSEVRVIYYYVEEEPKTVIILGEEIPNSCRKVEGTTVFEVRPIDDEIFNAAVNQMTEHHPVERILDL